MNRLSLLVFGLLMIVSVLSPFLALAGEGPSPQRAEVLALGLKIITGNVTLSDGVTPAASATVVATVLDLTTVRQTLYTSTDSNGYYQVTFAPTDWDVGNTIVVGASLGSAGGGGTVVADASPIQYVNISLNLVIPEFGTTAASIIVIAAVSLIVLGVRRKR